MNSFSSNGKENKRKTIRQTIRQPSLFSSIIFTKCVQLNVSNPTNRILFAARSRCEYCQQYIIIHTYTNKQKSMRSFRVFDQKVIYLNEFNFF